MTGKGEEDRLKYESIPFHVCEGVFYRPAFHPTAPPLLPAIATLHSPPPKASPPSLAPRSVLVCAPPRALSPRAVGLPAGVRVSLRSGGLAFVGVLHGGAPRVRCGVLRVALYRCKKRVFTSVKVCTFIKSKATFGRCCNTVLNFHT